MAEPYSGYITLRLAPAAFGHLLTEVDDLRALANLTRRVDFVRLLNEYSQVSATRLVRSVPPSRILELDSRATARGWVQRHSLTTYWQLDARGIPNPDRLVHLLNQLDDVDLAYRALSGSDPAVIDPTDDVHAFRQHYLEPAPMGIHAHWAWTHRHGSGGLVGFVDLEQGWMFGHEDLPPIVSLAGVSQDVNPFSPSSVRHGTAVLGVVAAQDNSTGVVGIAPKLEWMSVTSHFHASDGSNGHVAEAVLNVLPHMAEGDVLLIEWQDGFNRPAETDPATWDAINEAFGLGIIVIEAAGNGNQSLDSVAELQADSGAIIVAACHADLDATNTGHDRWVLPANPQIGSNFGQRIDCHAFGEHVVTTGPGANDAGSLEVPGTAPEKQYRQDFGGTSAAAAIVAGAAVVLQGIQKGTAGTVLSPTELRRAFRTHGTAQGTGRPGDIKLMPDLKKAAMALFPVPPAPTNVRINQ